MNLKRALITILSLGVAVAQAQDQAANFDAEAAKAKLSSEVKKTPGRFIVRSIGGDPVTKRIMTRNAVVITHASGATEEHPYTQVQLLFQKNSDELLDATSRENVVKLANILKDLSSSTFAVEGHASAEGDQQRNLDLSKLRALKIQSLLLDEGVAAGELSRVDGFGAEYARHPATAPESQLREDRRVLVVREN